MKDTGGTSGAEDGDHYICTQILVFSEVDALGYSSLTASKLSFAH